MGGYCRLQMPLSLASGRQWLGVGWAPWGVPFPLSNAGLREIDATTGTEGLYPGGSVLLWGPEGLLGWGWGCGPWQTGRGGGGGVTPQLIHQSPSPPPSRVPPRWESGGPKGGTMLGPAGVGGGGHDALEGKGPQRRPQRRLGRRLEGVGAGVGVWVWGWGCGCVGVWVWVWVCVGV